MRSNWLNSEKNSYQYSTEEKLIKDYNPELRRIENHAVFDRLFGTPPENIVIEAVTVVGFGKNLDQTHTLHIHQKLIPTIQRLFEHILKFNKKLPPERRYYLQANETKKLSPHAWGIAIDLNSNENKSTSWSIPRWVVKLFEFYGFCWGGFGFNRNGNKEPDHFEYALHEINPLPPLNPPLFPFVKSEFEHESAMRNFHRNESNIGGYFPLTMNNEALHGGVHLHPDDPKKPQPVRVSHPGYVVAARIAPSSSNAEVKAVAHVGNYTGFVLIRHEVRKSGETEYKSIYSLYMHLKPIDTTNLAPGRVYHWQRVDWLRKLYQHRHGSVICVNNPKDTGKQGWLQEPFTEQTTEVPIFAEKEWKQETIKAGTGEGPDFLLKPPPKDMEKMIKAFEKGEMITFTQPFLTVKAGEIIGFTLSPPTHGSSSIAKFKRSLFTNFQKDFTSGFLHWELFTPSEEKTLHELLELVEINKEAITEATKKGNTIDRNKLAQLVNELETNAGDETLEKLQRKTARANVAYNLELVRFMNSSEGFGKEGDDDQIKKQQLEGPSYPIRIAFENFSGEPIPKMDYSCTVTFPEDPDNQESYQITVSGKGEPTITIDLQIPVKTSEILLESKELGLDWRYKIDQEDPWFRQLVTRRWRDRILTHENEWHKKPMTDFVQVRKDRKEFTEKSSIKDLETFLWWNEKQQNLNFIYNAPEGGTGTVELDPFGENRTSSLFGPAPDQLPEMTDLTNINPITGTWLLALLQERKQIEIRDSWNPEPGKETSELLYLGWGAETETGDGIDWKPENTPRNERAIPYGRNSYIAAVYLREFNTPTKITATSSTGELLTLFNETCEEGKLVRQLPFTFWGDWQIEASGKQSIYQKQKLPTKVTGIKPEVSQLPPPERITGNRYRWEIPIKTGTIDRLQALLMVRYRVIKETKWNRASAFQMSDCGQYILDANNLRGKVANNFSFLEYYRKRNRQTPFKLSRALVDAVQAFREACDLGVNIIRCESTTGDAALVRVGYRWKESIDENSETKIITAINRGKTFLKEDQNSKNPLFTEKSHCLNNTPCSQLFYLEAQPSPLKQTEEMTLSKFAIPVDSINDADKMEHFKGYRMSKDKRFYKEVFSDANKIKSVGTTFSFDQYRFGWQKSDFQEGLLRPLLYFTEGVGRITATPPIISRRSATGREIALKSPKNSKLFHQCGERLIQLKNARWGLDDKEITITVESDQKELLPFLNQFTGKKLSQIPTEDETTVRFSAIHNDCLTELLENLKYLKSWQNKRLTLFVPKEEIDQFCDKDLRFNQYLRHESFKKSHPPEVARISRDLIEGIDRFGEQTKRLPLRINRVDEAGWKARLEPRWDDHQNRQQLSQAAKKREGEQSANYRIIPETKEAEVRLSNNATPLPEPQTKIITFSLDQLIQTIAEAETENAKESVLAELELGLRFLNGGFFMLETPPTFSKSSDANPVPLTTPKTAEMFVDRWSYHKIKTAIGSKRHFGPIHRKINYQSDEAEVLVSVPLHGSLESWKQSFPFFTIQIGEKTIRCPHADCIINAESGVLEASFPIVMEGIPLNRELLSNPMTITVKDSETTQDPPMERTEEFPPIMPKIHVEKTELIREELVIHYEAANWPGTKMLELFLDKKNSKTDQFEQIAPEGTEKQRENLRGIPINKALTLRLNRNMIPGYGEYRFRLDRPKDPENPGKQRSIYGATMIPVIGTFKTDPFPVEFGKPGKSEITGSNLILVMEEATMDEEDGTCLIRCDYKNWPVGKYLKLTIERYDPETGIPVPLEINTGDPELVSYDPPGYEDKWAGKTYGKAEGEGTLTIQFHQGLLLPNSRYRLLVESPEDSEVLPGSKLPPCKIELKTGAIPIKKIWYRKGKKAEQEGILELKESEQHEP